MSRPADELEDAYLRLQRARVNLATEIMRLRYDPDAADGRAPRRIAAAYLRLRAEMGSAAKWVTTDPI